MRHRVLMLTGTFIECQVPASHKLRFLNARKGGATGTNLLLACNFDMYITFASVGAEGSAHDGFVLRRATAARRLRLPVGHFQWTLSTPLRALSGTQACGMSYCRAKTSGRLWLWHRTVAVDTVPRSPVRYCRL